MIQHTLVLLKPDCLERRLAGKILARFEQKGLRLVAMKLMQVTEELAARHYAEHTEKPFYPALREYITSNPVVAMVLEGRDAITVVRTMVGATKGWLATPGTIRGDFSLSGQRNLVHASDSEESAAREISIFFQSSEIVTWKSDDTPTLLAKEEY